MRATATENNTCPWAGPPFEQRRAGVRTCQAQGPGGSRTKEEPGARSVHGRRVCSGQASGTGSHWQHRTSCSAGTRASQRAQVVKHANGHILLQDNVCTREAGRKLNSKILYATISCETRGECSVSVQIRSYHVGHCLAALCSQIIKIDCT